MLLLLPLLCHLLLYLGLLQPRAHILMPLALLLLLLLHLFLWYVWQGHPGVVLVWAPASCQPANRRQAGLLTHPC
jgi:hypothetical protein